MQATDPLYLLNSVALINAPGKILIKSFFFFNATVGNFDLEIRDWENSLIIF